MPQDNRNHALWIYIAIAISLAVLFAIDLLMPMRVAIWVFYVLPVVLCMWINRPAVPIITAGAGSVLMILGYVLSTGDSVASREVLQLNRAMGIFVLLVLSIVAHLYIKSRLAVQRTAWLQEGVAQMSLQLRGEQSPASIGVSILRSLIPYVNAKVGVVYVLEGETLERIAAWALPDENGAPRRIARGEGLVGQAIVDKRVLQLRDASAHYLKAGSALGAASASRVIVAPLYADGDVAGAIEVGFVGDEGRFDDARVLLELAAEAMGMAMRSARYRMRLVELLEETQRQSEELQVQQEELRVSNEELEERAARCKTRRRVSNSNRPSSNRPTCSSKSTRSISSGKDRTASGAAGVDRQRAGNGAREPVQVRVPREHVA